MNVLILGGSRFIGRRLAEEMSGAGHTVTLFNRGRSDDGLGTAVDRLAGDRRLPGALAAAVANRRFDVAYDFVSYTAADAAGATAALEGRVAHFIQISTCSVYWCTGEFPCPVEEEWFDRHGDFGPRPGSIEYDYGYNKRKAEEELFAAHRSRGFPVTAIRMPVVGGEGDLSLRYASYALRAGDGGPVLLPDSGLAPFRQVYVGDVTATLASIARDASTMGRAYNLAGHEILTVRSIVEGVAAVLGRTVEMVPIPSGALAGLEGGHAISPFSQPAAQVPAIHRARREIGWSPRPWSSWLEAAVLWGIEHCRRTGVVPEPYALRPAELEAIRRYRGGPSTSGAPDGTSASRPG